MSRNILKPNPSLALHVGVLKIYFCICILTSDSVSAHTCHADRTCCNFWIMPVLEKIMRWLLSGIYALLRAGCYREEVGYVPALLTRMKLLMTWSTSRTWSTNFLPMFFFKKRYLCVGQMKYICVNMGYRVCHHLKRHSVLSTTACFHISFF